MVKFPQNHPKNESRITIASVRCSVMGFPLFTGLRGDEGLWKSGVQKCDETATGVGGGSAVYFDPGREGCVVGCNYTVRVAGVVFGDHGRERGRGGFP